MKPEHQKYKGRSLGWLLSKTQHYFNLYIRLRDRGKRCVSCGSRETVHASHFYPVGSYASLRFNEMNCHASCVRCNTFKHGNLHEYRRLIVDRIGKEGLDELDRIADEYRRNGWKWNRSDVIDLLEHYKRECRENTKV